MYLNNATSLGNIVLIFSKNASHFKILPLHLKKLKIYYYFLQHFSVSSYIFSNAFSNESYLFFLAASSLKQLNTCKKALSASTYRLPIVSCVPTLLPETEYLNGKYSFSSFLNISSHSIP